MPEINNISNGQSMNAPLQCCPRADLASAFILPEGRFEENSANNDRPQNKITFSTSADTHVNLLSQKVIDDSDYHSSLFYFFYLLIKSLLSPVLILKKQVIALYCKLKLKRDVKHSPSFSWVHDHQTLKVRRGKIKISDLSLEKRFILECLSDEEIEALLNMSDDLENAKEPFKIESDLCLDEATINKLNIFRDKRQRLDMQETRWLTTVESLLHCKYQKPQGFDGLSVQQIYRKLYDFLTAHYLPEAFVLKVVPELVYYVVNGEMKSPLLLVGAPGCGKTTAVKIISEALSMVSCHFDAVTKDTSHGLFGEAKSFQNPECGDLASGVSKAGVLNPIFHIDEPDKTSSPTTRARFQDELLSLCDNSRDDYTDNFLGFSLPLKGVIIIFTANTTDTISAPLLDRCEVIRFKDIEENRVQSIISEYAESEGQSMLYREALILNHEALHKAVATLYGQGIHSIRQHKKMVDRAFFTAFNYYVFNSEEKENSVVVDDALFTEAMNSGEFVTVKKAGF